MAFSAIGRRRAARPLRRLASGALLVACLALAACRPAAPATAQDVVIGQEQATAVLAATSGQPALPREQAIRLAERQATGWPVATAVTARYLRLTLRDRDGTVRAGLDGRPVWLVTFVGLAFLPPNAPEPGCPCKGYYQRANTAAAVDARTGDVVAVFGVNSDGRA